MYLENLKREEQEIALRSWGIYENVIQAVLNEIEKEDCNAIFFSDQQVKDSIYNDEYYFYKHDVQACAACLKDYDDENIYLLDSHLHMCQIVC